MHLIGKRPCIFKRKIEPDRNAHHIERREDRRDRQGCRAEDARPAARRSGGRPERPLAEEGAEGRHAHKREAGQRKDRRRHRHLFTEALHVRDVFHLVGVQDRPRAEKEGDLDDRVKDHVDEAAGKTGRTHDRKAEEAVREVRDRRVRESSLKVRLAQSHRRAVDDRKGRGRHDDRLGPGPLKEVASKAEVYEPHDRKCAGLNDRHGVQEGRDRGRRDRGRRQPLVERKERRLDAKAEKAEHKSGEQDRRVTGCRCKIKKPAGDKIERVRVPAGRGCHCSCARV